jgi:hypothetical protein
MIRFKLLAFAENAKFESTFSPKTLKMIRKNTVMKTMLNFTPHFRQQREVIENVKYLGEFEDF